MAGILHKIGETLHVGGQKEEDKHKEGDHKQEHKPVYGGEHKPEHSGEHKEGLMEKIKDKVQGDKGEKKKVHGDKSEKKKKEKKKHGEGHHDDSSSSDSD